MQPLGSGQLTAAQAQPHRCFLGVEQFVTGGQVGEADADRHVGQLRRFPVGRVQFVGVVDAVAAATEQQVTGGGDL